MGKAQFVLGTIVLVWLAGGSPARADYDYAWCIQNSEYGYPGDCSYQTREQCQMSASGRRAIARKILPRWPYGLRFSRHYAVGTFVRTSRASH